MKKRTIALSFFLAGILVWILAVFALQATTFWSLVLPLLLREVVVRTSSSQFADNMALLIYFFSAIGYGAALSILLSPIVFVLGRKLPDQKSRVFVLALIVGSLAYLALLGIANPLHGF